MDMFQKLSRNAQIVLGGAVLYLLFSFFDWQQVSVLGTSVGDNEWHGIGFVACLAVLLLLAWEIARMLQMSIAVGSLSPGLVSLALAVILLVLTIIAFLDFSTARHWPAYLGLILSFVIAFFGYRRSKEEGVELPSMPSSTPPSG
jgi:cellobiose-specific phosphotransferase system component IIC